MQDLSSLYVPFACSDLFLQKKKAENLLLSELYVQYLQLLQGLHNLPGSLYKDKNLIRTLSEVPGLNFCELNFIDCCNQEIGELQALDLLFSYYAQIYF